MGRWNCLGISVVRGGFRVEFGGKIRLGIKIREVFVESLRRSSVEVR